MRRFVVGILILVVTSFSACGHKINVSSLAKNETKVSQEKLAQPSSGVKNETAIQWLTMEEAYAKNQHEPRKTFVDVYTDWCGWCKKMDRETFANAEVAEYVNENYYAVKLDAESTRAFELGGQKMTEQMVAQQLGVRSFPTIVLIHEDFQKYQPVPGYRPAKEFQELLIRFREIDIHQKN